MQRRSFLALALLPWIRVPHHAGCLHLEHASTRLALDMVFHAYNREYVLTPAVGGLVSLVLERVSFEEQIRRIVAGSSIPVNYSVENGVYVFDSPIPVRDEDVYTVFTQDCQPALLPLEAVFRRVSGIRFERDSKGALQKPTAIVLVGDLDSWEQFIVGVGDWVPSGAPGFGDMQVTAIHRTSVDLATRDTDLPLQNLRVFMRNRGLAPKR